MRLTGASWTVFDALHLIYHVDHLDMYGGFDHWANLISLLVTLLAGVFLLFPH